MSAEMWNFSVVFLIFLLAPVWCIEDGASGIQTNKVENGEPEIILEADCTRFGGICLPEKSCPPGKISEEGRCPKQAQLGVVCCHDLPVTETRCERLGGHCTKSCPEKLVTEKATDCPKEEKCCTLV